MDSVSNEAAILPHYWEEGGNMEAILLVVVCLVGSAFFSSSETALLRLRPADLEPGDDGEIEPIAPAAKALLQSTSRLLVTILFGNNVVNILGAAVASAIGIAALGPELGVAVSTVVMTVVVLVFCEVLPKALAAAHPLGVSRVVALPLYLFHQMMWPLHHLFSRVIDPMVLRITGRQGEERLGAEEVLRMAREIPTAPGTAPTSIIAATARAAEMTVEEIMVERTEIVALPISLPAESLLEQMLAERFTRVPVYGESIDRFVGILHLKDLVRLVQAGEGDVRGILRSVLRVPERKPILSLLAEMQRNFNHLAIVKDEHGVTRGLVTAEDILEELVGEIRDEHDREELQTIVARDGGYEALGRVKVLDFQRETGWEIPAERGDTLSGTVFNALGRAPRRHDRLTLDGFEIEVLEVSGTRIARLSVRRRDDAETGEGGR
jgi:putative hemolysin